DRAVALFDQEARHAAPAELDRDGETDRAAADDQHRDGALSHRRHPRPPCCARSWSGLERVPVQILGALDLDEDAEALLLGIAILLGLDQALPDLVIDLAGLVDLGGTVEACDAALGQYAGL